MSLDTLKGKPLYTASEVLAILQISKPTLYRLFKRGNLKKVKLGRSMRVRQADLNAYIESLTDDSRPFRKS